MINDWREFRQFFNPKKRLAVLKKLVLLLVKIQERLMNRLDFSGVKIKILTIMLLYFVSLEFYNPFFSSVII